MVDVVTTTIRTPTTGYIVVEANANHYVGNTGAGIQNLTGIEIDEVAGGSYQADWSRWSGCVSCPAGSSYSPVSVRRTYYKVAGTYTFRLEAMLNMVLPGGSMSYLHNPEITATFFPSSYGDVTTGPAGPEKTQDQNLATPPFGSGSVR
jgi:hypothetical protein